MLHSAASRVQKRSRPPPTIDLAATREQIWQRLLHVCFTRLSRIELSLQRRNLFLHCAFSLLPRRCRRTHLLLALLGKHVALLGDRCFERLNQLILPLRLAPQE